ncbi:TPM domain-containing protein [Thermoflexibacter ruber]|uniref:TPM domain-containing protein n=1 Tax=Thermoflexibacter ruber TaxID=1003 RepID=A0A1I2B7Q7_9BACT|nr:TPM domain-containing protein [Thermoflexibacter ruber]SFE52106.1 uncharacterized protein SAMN04488541_1002165 [Thermoflexibacter ruber]
MKYALIFLCCFGISYQTFSQNSLVRPKPEPAVFVNDYAEVLSRAEIQKLEEKLRQFDKTTSNQLAIVILPSLEGNIIDVLANQWFKAWGIGQKNKDNGLLILIAIQDRKMHIEVGYGLNKVVTSSEAQKVIENQLKPNFRNNQFFKGLDEATTYLMGLAIQKFPPQANNSPALPDSNNVISSSIDGLIPYVAIATIIIIIMVLKYGHPKYKQPHVSQNNSFSYRKNNTSNRNPYYHNTNYHNNNASTSYYYYTNNDTSSNDSDSSSSDSDSSYGGGDSGGDGASGDW